MGFDLFLFGVSWANPSLGVGYPLRVEGSFVRKGWKLVWKVGPLFIFWTVWRARIFRDEVLSIQKLKFFFFVNLLWSKINLFIECGPTTLCQFIDWVGVN